MAVVYLAFRESFVNSNGGQSFLSVFYNPIACSIDASIRISLNQIGHFFEKTRFPPIVCIEEADIRRRAFCYTTVSGCADTGIILLYKPDATVFDGFYNFATAIDRSIVYHHQLPIMVCLCYNTLHGLADVGRLVVEGNDDAVLNHVLLIVKLYL